MARRTQEEIKLDLKRRAQIHEVRRLRIEREILMKENRDNERLFIEWIRSAMLDGSIEVDYDRLKVAIQSALFQEKANDGEAQAESPSVSAHNSVAGNSSSDEMDSAKTVEDHQSGPVHEDDPLLASMPPHTESNVTPITAAVVARPQPARPQPRPALQSAQAGAAVKPAEDQGIFLDS